MLKPIWCISAKLLLAKTSPKILRDWGKTGTESHRIKGKTPTSGSDLHSEIRAVRQTSQAPQEADDALEEAKPEKIAAANEGSKEI